MNEKIIDLIQKFLLNEITVEEKHHLYELLNRKEITKRQLESYYKEKWIQARHKPSVNPESKERSWKIIQTKLAEEFQTEKKQLNKWYRVAGIAAALVFCVWIGYTLNFSRNEPQEMVAISVENGQKAHVKLPDGSLVWLNSTSEIQYFPDFGKKKRNVRLIGEAYFEVATNPEKPFTVETHDGLHIKALGTKFNVKSYPNDKLTAATLLEGKVNISNKAISENMQPKDHITFNASENNFRRTRIQEEDEVIFWLTGQFVFNGETLYNITKILERMYNVTFIFEAPETKTIKYTGKIKNNSLDNVLSLITTVSPLTYTIKDTTITLSKKE